MLLTFLVCWFLSLVLCSYSGCFMSCFHVRGWGVYAANWFLFPVMFWILGYVYQCLCYLCVKLFLMILYIWYFSNVFKCFPFLCILIISIIFVMVPYVCTMFNIWLEYPKLLLLLLIACTCSMYLVWKVPPVHPIYFSGQSRHFISWMPLLLYLTIHWCFIMFCITFCILNAIFIHEQTKMYEAAYPRDN
jgi:hypothetical protein